LQIAGAKPEEIYPLIEHLKMGCSPLDDLHGQTVRDRALFTGKNGLVLKYLIMRGIDHQLASSDSSEEGRRRKVAAEALRELLVRTNQEAL
jgi:hypothetical protein